MELSLGSVLLSFLPFLILWGISYWVVQAIAGRNGVMSRQAEALERIAKALEDRRA
jgi:hypothetical protein